MTFNITIWSLRSKQPTACLLLSTCDLGYKKFYRLKEIFRTTKEECKEVSESVRLGSAKIYIKNSLLVLK